LGPGSKLPVFRIAAMARSAVSSALNTLTSML
jgi:hypothetical protein